MRARTLSRPRQRRGGIIAAAQRGARVASPYSSVQRNRSPLPRANALRQWAGMLGAHHDELLAEFGASGFARGAFARARDAESSSAGTPARVSAAANESSKASPKVKLVSRSCPASRSRADSARCIPAGVVGGNCRFARYAETPQLKLGSLSAPPMARRSPALHRNARAELRERVRFAPWNAL
jgi:hypothetical protein